MTQIETTDTPIISPTMEDLILAVEIIKICNSRGGFLPEEMEIVGGLYNRLILFLEKSGALKATDSSKVL